MGKANGRFKFADNLSASEYYDFFLNYSKSKRDSPGSRSRSTLCLTEIYSARYKPLIISHKPFRRGSNFFFVAFFENVFRESVSDNVRL